MDPNSRNQTWSKWMWTVYPGRPVALPFEPVKQTIARFTRSWFGSAGQMRITERIDHYVVELLTEGRPAHDPDFAAHTEEKFRIFFVSQFGVGTRVNMAGPRLMAGSRQDGTPSEQLIILPPLDWGALAKG